jgi:hypothetical protein
MDTMHTTAPHHHANPTRREIPELLARMQSFSTGTMRGGTDGDGIYRVHSYAVEIARVEDTPEGLRRTINETKYSVTTSGQQTLCRAYLPGEDAE